MELAKRLGLTQMAIANYDRGSLKPDVELVPKTAQRLGASMEDLYGGEGRKPVDAPTQRLHRNTPEAKVQGLFGRLRPDWQKMILRQVEGLIGQDCEHYPEIQPSGRILGQARKLGTIKNGDWMRISPMLCLCHG